MQCLINSFLWFKQLGEIILVSSVLDGQFWETKNLKTILMVTFGSPDH